MCCLGSVNNENENFNCVLSELVKLVIGLASVRGSAGV